MPVTAIANPKDELGTSTCALPMAPEFARMGAGGDGKAANVYLKGWKSQHASRDLPQADLVIVPMQTAARDVISGADALDLVRKAAGWISLGENPRVCRGCI